MQRVAIARALVNDPEILLADEPTGALDSETSIQVMDLLKEVSKDRLVVMVTHNPELAEAYANRIVRVKDGKIIGDTNPYTPAQVDILPAEHKNMGKASMSFLTALSLSFNNLRTKKGRTLLTAFAGSIGIIGIALIMALSTGFQRYVDQIQEDTLSSYPLVIRSETANMAAAMTSFGQAIANAGAVPEDTVREQPMISQMFASMGSNDLSAFKSYLEEHTDTIGHTLNAVDYDYGIRPYVFLSDTSDGIHQVNPGNLFTKLMNGAPVSAFMDIDLFQEMIDDRDLLASQYEVLQGRWPEAYNEVIVVLSSPSQMSDYMAYCLGMRDSNVLGQVIQKIMNGEEATLDDKLMQWSYDELMSRKLRLVNASDLYQYNETYGVWEDMSDDEAYMKDLINAGEELSIVGIICPKEGTTAASMSQGIAYTQELTDVLIQRAKESKIVQQQLANKNIDVFTGVEFGSDEKAKINFEDMIHVDGDMLSSAFGMNISKDDIITMMEQYFQNAASSLNIDTTPAQNDFTQTLNDMTISMLNGFVSQNADSSGSATVKLVDAEQIVDQYLSSAEANEKIAELSEKYQLSEDIFQRVYKPLLFGAVTGCIAEKLADSVIPPAPTEPTAPTETTIPDETAEAVPQTEPTEAARLSIPSDSLIPIEPDQIAVSITYDDISQFVPEYIGSATVTGAAKAMAAQMCQPEAQQLLLDMVSDFGSKLLSYIGNSFYVDTDKISNAFEFKLNEDELMRLLNVISSSKNEQSAEGNLSKLGYVEKDNPQSISIYFADFASKEEFLNFLDNYNQKMEEAEQEDLIIHYADFTGMMMSSVRTIIDSVSYVLIAFVAVSLLVSSIMIGIITYISVMERTKEIGVLRAIGASKHNISQVFNAETFIIGLCSGAIGVGTSLLLLLPCNYVIHSIIGNVNITAQLPVMNAVVLVVLSMILTMLGGLIPSKKAAQKDPVIALRSE